MNEELENKKEIEAKIKKYSVMLGGGLCVIAVLALVATLMTGNSENETQTTTTHVAEVEAEATNIPDERTYETIIVPATEITTAAEVAAPTEEVSTVPTTRSAPVSFSLPLGTDIGDDYSRGVPVYSEVMADWRTHDGIDFNGEYGDGVKAIANGVVKDVYSDALMGDTVVVDHGGGIVATYCGVTASEDIMKGIIVSESDKLGELSAVPSEADSEYPHLHLEITVNGELCDPLEVMGIFEEE